MGAAMNDRDRVVVVCLAVWNRHRDDSAALEI